MVRLRLHEHVRLRRSIGEVPAGARGSVVLIGEDGYEVEVFDEEGETIGVVPALSEDLESLDSARPTLA